MRIISASKYFFITTIVCCLFLVCKQPTNQKPPEPLIANAGPDQTTIVGSYTILDACQSSGDINWWDWEQDEHNPAEVFIYSGNYNFQPQIGFVEEGIYKFKLVVRKGVTPGNLSGTEASEPDEVIVTVNPNPQEIFEDRNLELAVRFKLKKQTETLTDNMLFSWYSLRCFSGADDITSLKGIERCANLEYLSMGLQNIENLTPLSNLTQLTYLNLTQNHHIKDIASGKFDAAALFKSG